MKPSRYAIKVIWPEGEEEYLKEGATADGPVAMFPNRERAVAQRDFMMEGMEEDVQSINVVPFPAESPGGAR